MTRLTHLRRALSLAVGIAGLVCSGLGQTTRSGASSPAPTTPTTPGSAGTGSTTTPGRTTTPTNPFPDPNQTTDPSQMQRPIFISGKVLLDSGTPPPESVTIERVCNGTPRAEAYTDSKGRFSFQLGQNNGMMQDASMGSSNSGLGGFGSGSGAKQTNPFGQTGISERDLNGCEIRASLAGYRSDMVPLTGHRSMDNPDLGTIVLHHMGNVEGVTVSASSLNAPKDAKKAFDKGSDLLKKKKIADGRKELERAVEIYPAYAAAWYELGQAKELQSDTEGAQAAYMKALTVDAKFLNPYQPLVGIYVKQQKWQEAADASGKLIKLDPVDYPEAHYYNAVSNYFLKNFDVAEKSIRDLQKLDTQNRMTKSSKLLGAILVEKQDYAGAAEQIKKYLSFLPLGEEDEGAKKQLIELERVAGAGAPPK
jgi:tetratricopeptide (TPR) repeat protein